MDKELRYEHNDINMTTLDGGVIIKKGTAPAPPSGGSEYEYFALTDGWDNDLGGTFALNASLVKAETSRFGMVILPEEYARLGNEGANIVPHAVALDMSLILSAAGQQITIKDSILASGTTEESLAKYRITKEEFYNLD